MHNHLHSFSPKFENSVTDCDVLIDAGEPPHTRQFLAHSNILRERSPYFAKALSEDWARPSGTTIRFRKPNIDPETFSVVLGFLYTGRLDVRKCNDFCALLIASDEMMLEGLLAATESHLLQHEREWVRRNAFDLLHILCPRDICPGLRDLCLDELLAHDQGAFFASHDFCALDEAVLCALLCRNDIDLDETNVWKSVVSWGIAQITSLTKETFRWTDENVVTLAKTLDRPLRLVRFTDISYERICEPDLMIGKLLPRNLVADIVHYHMTGEYLETSPLLPPRKQPQELDSVVIQKKHANLVSRWIANGNASSRGPSKTHYKLNLLYRSSRDGSLMTSRFRKTCENAGKTLVVAKLLDSDQIVGGFNPIKRGWRRGWFFSKRGKKNSFIFSLGTGRRVNEAKVSFVKPERRREAIFDHRWGGLCFGTGPDLWIGGAHKGQAVKKSYQHSIVPEEGALKWEELEIFSVERV